MCSFDCSRRIRLFSLLLSFTLLIGLFPAKHIIADQGDSNAGNLNVNYQPVSYWDDFTQVEVVIENVGNSPINGWQIEFSYDDTTTVSSIWGAITAPVDIATPNKIVVCNESYNGIITPSGTATFGLIVQGQVYEIPDTQVIAQPNNQTQNNESGLFSYAIFCQDGFLFQGWKSTISGDVYTGSNFDFQGSELSLYGNLDAVGTVNANGGNINIGAQNVVISPIPTPDFSSVIMALSSRMTPIDASAFTSQDQIVANGYYSTNGNLTISGTKFSGDCVIIADGDIVYNVDSLSGDGRVVLYSRHGNITINGSQISINGVLYAPEGNICINAYDTTLNGRIIANHFQYNGSILNVTASANDLVLLYDLPAIQISTSSDQIELGQTVCFSIDSEPNETPYEILFRLNGDNVVISEDSTYSFTPETIGAYVLEAYVETSTGIIILAQKTIDVINSESPTPTVTTEPEPTETPVPEPTISSTPEPTTTSIPTISPTLTDTPTPTPYDEEPVEISMNTDRFISTENDAYFYLIDRIDEVTGTLTNSDEVTSFTYSISSIYEDDCLVGTIPIAEEWSSSDIGFFFGPTLLKFSATTTSGQNYEKKYVILSFTEVNATKLGMSTDMDSDGDYLSDYMESELGTFIDVQDSDEDLIIDSIEVYFLQTDPMNPDSDGDGIIDGNEDFDSDGLGNAFELDNGTMFYNPDSDEDLLSDGDEVNVYGTDPNNPDSDNDGVSDYEEVMMGSDPNVPDVAMREQTAEYTVEIEEAPEIVGVSISLATERYLPSVLTVNDLYNVNMPITEVVGRVGSPFEFESAVDFDQAVVVFSYDDSKLGTTNESDLGLLWYDEENRRFEIVESVVVDTNANTVTATLDHFSKYVLVDLAAWNLIWSTPIDYYEVPDSDTERYDYIFMVESSSATTNAFKNTAQSIIEQFVSRMRAEERFGIGAVGSNRCQFFQTLTNNKPTIQQMIGQALSVSMTGYTYNMTYTFQALQDIYDNSGSNGNIPVVILITTNTNFTYNNSYCLNVCNDLGARVYTINLGAPGGWSTIINTNHLRNYGELDDTLDQLMIDTDGYELVGYNRAIQYVYDFFHGREKDSDGDGIPNVYEIRGIRSFTGRIITSNPYNPDSNHDGYDDWYEYMLSDYELVYRRFEELYNDLPEFRGQHILQTWRDPNTVDNDGDGLHDNYARFYFNDNDEEVIVLPIDPDPDIKNLDNQLTEKHVQLLSDNSTVQRFLSNDQVAQVQGALLFNSNSMDLLVDELWDYLVDVMTGNSEEAQLLVSFLGCWALGFYDDQGHIAAHSKEYQWQRYFGYCDLYDDFFDIGTNGNMRRLKMPSFEYNGEEYIFWGWRGDYLNLGSGAEIGFYYIPNDFDDLGYESFLAQGTYYLNMLVDFVSNGNLNAQWWAVAPYSIEMELDLYTNKNGHFESVSNWHPYEKQWWITAFNYHDEYRTPDVNNLYVIGKIAFEHAKNDQGYSCNLSDMYYSFKNSVQNNHYKNSQATIIFEDSSHSVYIIWGYNVYGESYT